MARGEIAIREIRQTVVSYAVFNYRMVAETVTDGTNENG